MSEHQWYYQKSTAIEDVTAGPISETAFVGLLQSGEITPTSLIASPTRTGNAWVPMSQLAACMKYWEQGEAKRQAERARQAAEKEVARRRHAEVIRIQREQRQAQLATIRSQEVAQQQKRADFFAQISEEPNLSLVEPIYLQVKELLTEGEEISYIAVQRRPVVNIKPDAVAATTRRLVFFRPKLLGRFDFFDYLWRELSDAHIKQGILTSTFFARHVSGRVLSMDYLPKDSAIRLYRIAQEREEWAIEERRRRAMEEKRAGASQIAIQANIPSPSPTATAGNSVEADPAERIRKLKSLLDGGLITLEEFERRKSEIISGI